jgi:hypothetical protein
MQTPTLTYSFSITTGSLLYEETCKVLDSFDVSQIFDVKGKLNFQFLSQNSDVSKKTIGQEILKRIRSTEWPELWEQFNSHSEKDKRLLLFYALCCYYSMVQDFMIEVYHKKWLNMDTAISREDIAYFIDVKSAFRPEINDLQLYTKQKIAQVIFRSLQEAGLVSDGKIVDPDFSSDLITSFRHKGEMWFLEIIHQNKL